MRFPDVHLPTVHTFSSRRPVVSGVVTVVGIISLIYRSLLSLRPGHGWLNWLAMFMTTGVAVRCWYRKLDHRSTSLHSMSFTYRKSKRKVGGTAMKRVAAGAHLSLAPSPWLFEPAIRRDNRADYCLDCSRKL